MNILLVNPPVQVNVKPEIPSLGISCISHALEKKGYEVEVLDIDGYRYTKETVSDFIKKSNARIIGIGGLATVYSYLHWLVPEIKKLKPDSEIILGGAVASSLRERCFNRLDIDYEVIGEGEITVTELVREITTSRNFKEISGIGYRSQDGEVIFTKRRPLMDSLNEVPMLRDELFPMETYLENARGFMQIHAQRGCPHACTFCFNCYRVVSDKV
ncbi:MAG: cobalamin-dependent protein, partial [Candidatus Omnitrophica bacterium]|nr:cobalamin-dependent protein [Candidatus Omnitrophota bacterium]